MMKSAGGIGSRMGRLVCAMVVLAGLAAAEDQQTRPNVLVLAVDDRNAWIGCPSRSPIRAVALGRERSGKGSVWCGHGRHLTRPRIGGSLFLT
jgi:hypothetical protein